MTTDTRLLNAKVWKKEEHGHYVEPQWISSRLFDVEKFNGTIHDPACGFGRICRSAGAAGYISSGSDIVERGHGSVGNFLESEEARDNVVSNPPYHIFKAFTERSLKVSRYKVAMVCLVRRLNAARWLQDTPLVRVWLLTPRPSMPPGYIVADLEKEGKTPSGGIQDFCWLVFDKQREYMAQPEIRWLCRDL